MVIKMLDKLERWMDKQSKNFNRVENTKKNQTKKKKKKKNQTDLKNKITEIKVQQ